MYRGRASRKPPLEKDPRSHNAARGALLKTKQNLQTAI